MGVGQQSHALYYSIFDGQICRKVTAPTATSKERTNKLGKIVHEEHYGYIDGIITGIFTREHVTYGKSWIIVLDDEGTKQFLQMPYSGGTTSAFLKMLPNIDLAATVKIIPNKKTVEGKEKTSLFVTQDGVPVKWFWNKENPGELPPMEKKKVKGKETWDDWDQMEYLEKYVVTEILPQLKQSNIVQAAAPVNTVSGPSTGNGAGTITDIEPIDDVPF